MARSRDEIDELIASREQAGKMLDEGASWLRRLQLRKKNGAESGQRPGIDLISLR